MIIIINWFKCFSFGKYLKLKNFKKILKQNKELCNKKML